MEPAGFEYPWAADADDSKQHGGDALDGPSKVLAQVPRLRSEQEKLEIVLQQVDLAALAMPNAAVVTCKNIDDSWSRPSRFSSFSLACKAAQLKLADKPEDSKQLSSRPPFVRVGGATGSAFKALFVFELDGRATQEKVVEVYSTLRQNCDEFGDAGCDTVVLPVFGHNLEQNMPLRTPVQEAISLVYYMVRQRMCDDIKRVVLATPNSTSYDQLVAAFNLEQVFLREMSSLEVTNDRTNLYLDIDSHVQRVKTWNETKNADASHQLLRHHLNRIVEAWDDDTDEKQIALVICQHGEHVAQYFVDQYKHLPILANALTLESRIRVLGTGIVEDDAGASAAADETQTGKLSPRSRALTHSVTYDGGAQQKRKSTIKPTLSKLQYSQLEVLRRLGEKTQHPSHAHLLNYADCACAVRAIIALIGTLHSGQRRVR
eukprot:TRINITY_DN60941_c0_g1_i2.p1 TRINITY_DN60941_c0_g1~~TRINITY_DN60941_c0_g1_i2.p1  ORF type:complete len:476 (+),score=228.79 TRINITY_DN60941_c0_g1_i2:134-1429(+)